MHDDLSNLLRDLAHHNKIPGAQLAFYHRGKLLELVTGMEHAHQGPSVTRRSRFALGSVSKVLTASVIMLLCKDGDVDLDAPVARYLPRGAPAGGAAGSISLRQILSHTSGLVGDHDVGNVQGSSLRKQATSVLAEDLVCAPGSAFSYSNSGYSVAGYVIEAVTGLPWWEALQSYLFDPYDLDFTFVDGSRVRHAPPSVVSGHVVSVQPGTVTPVDFYCEPALAPAGGVAASASTLVKFVRSFMLSQAHRVSTAVADAETLRSMWSPVDGAEPFGLADSWGSGWALYMSGDRVWAGHDGTLEGGTCHVRFDAAGGTALALTTNATTGLAMWSQLVEALDDRGISVGDYQPPKLGGQPEPDRLDVDGRYVNGDVAVVVEPAPDGGHRMLMPNGHQGQITCYDDLRISVKVDQLGRTEFAGRLILSPDSDRVVSSIEYNGRRLRRADSR